MQKEKISKIIHWILLTAGSLLAIPLAYGCFIEPLRLTVREETVAIKGLPDSFDGCRMLLISDTHFSAYPSSVFRMKRLIKKVPQLKPDIICLLGDYIAVGSTRHKGSMSEADLMHFFSSLKAPGGVYAVLGNHELWYGRAKMMELLQRSGVTLLEGRSTDIKSGSGRIVLAGAAEIKTANFDRKKFFSGLDYSVPVLVMSHTPDIRGSVPPETALLMVADTHGGQIRCSGIWKKFQRLFDRSGVPPGLSKYRGSQIFLTSGAGGHRMDFRLFCPPEVAVVTLRKKL